MDEHLSEHGHRNSCVEMSLELGPYHIDDFGRRHLFSLRSVFDLFFEVFQ